MFKPKLIKIIVVVGPMYCSLMGIVINICVYGSCYNGWLDTSLFWHRERPLLLTLYISACGPIETERPFGSLGNRRSLLFLWPPLASFSLLSLYSDWKQLWIDHSSSIEIKFSHTYLVYKFVLDFHAINQDQILIQGL